MASNNESQLVDYDNVAKVEQDKTSAPPPSYAVPDTQTHYAIGEPRPEDDLISRLSTHLLFGGETTLFKPNVTKSDIEWAVDSVMADNKIKLVDFAHLEAILGNQANQRPKRSRLSCRAVAKGLMNSGLCDLGTRYSQVLQAVERLTLSRNLCFISSKTYSLLAKAMYIP